MRARLSMTTSLAILAIAFASCSDSGGTSSATGGNSGASGGATGTGGLQGSGGAVGTGGHLGSGGIAATGGHSGTGGALGTGGESETGGRPGTGGHGGAGGPSPGTGGEIGAGGKSASGGAPGNGGTTATGGTMGQGGGSGATTGMGGGTGAGGSGAAVPSAGCGQTPKLKNSPSTTANYNMATVGTANRRYILRLPDNYDNNHPYRLILSYHWATGSASQVFNCHTEGIDCYTTQNPFFGLWPLSDSSTIFIAPDGTTGQAADSGSTNSNYWYNTGGQDVAFTDEILKQVEADLCIDTSRIELEGFSMGGAMVNTLVCTHPGVFRAVAAHSAGGQPLLTTCQPIPYFASLGSQESGGQTSTADAFAKTNGCTIQTLPKAPTGGHVCSMYPGCSAGHPVRWCPFDGGHTPSPKDSGQSTTWMPKEVWSFFTQY